jgi:hypothetical protein
MLLSIRESKRGSRRRRRGEDLAITRLLRILSLLASRAL